MPITATLEPWSCCCDDAIFFFFRELLWPLRLIEKLFKLFTSACCNDTQGTFFLIDQVIDITVNNNIYYLHFLQLCLYIHSFHCLFTPLSFFKSQLNLLCLYNLKFHRVQKGKLKTVAVFIKQWDSLNFCRSQVRRAVLPVFRIAWKR